MLVVRQRFVGMTSLLYALIVCYYIAIITPLSSLESDLIILITVNPAHILRFPREILLK